MRQWSQRCGRGYERQGTRPPAGKSRLDLWQLKLHTRTKKLRFWLKFYTHLPNILSFAFPRVLYLMHCWRTKLNLITAIKRALITRIAIKLTNIIQFVASNWNYFGLKARFYYFQQVIVLQVIVQTCVVTFVIYISYSGTFAHFKLRFENEHMEKKTKYTVEECKVKSL